MATLQDYTGQESGAVLFDEGTIWIGNWSSINGIPREFAHAAIGLNDLTDDSGELLPCEVIAPPGEVIQAMLDHEQEVDPGTDPTPEKDFHAISIPKHNVIVVWADTWN